MRHHHAFDPCSPLPHGGFPPLLHQAWISPTAHQRQEARGATSAPAASELGSEPTVHEEDVPSQLLPMVVRWRTVLPGWSRKLWTIASSRQLWLDHRPDLIDVYDRYSNAVQRADASRYLYMLKYGGIYADLDVAPCNTIFSALATLNRTKQK